MSTLQLTHYYITVSLVRPHPSTHAAFIFHYTPVMFHQNKVGPGASSVWGGRCHNFGPLSQTVPTLNQAAVRFHNCVLHCFDVICPHTGVSWLAYLSVEAASLALSTRNRVCLPAPLKLMAEISFLSASRDLVRHITLSTFCTN